jgi:uroporphyrin-III C-methyltransferase/precorrin-2 dehydrogenase/sirohydrochlorin ferrochelatase
LINATISSTLSNSKKLWSLRRIVQALRRAAADALLDLRRHRRGGVSKCVGIRNSSSSGRPNPTNASCVTLVGAGPGNVELLTIKAARAIQSAEVVLYDALVCDDVLAIARADAELIAVGKRGGRRSCRQDDINRLMVMLAKSNKRIVRLKAGDPSIFGRAGEEINFLRAAGIVVDIIPGVTAASAMAAAFGLSLTHRDHTKSVRFVTGHSKSGGFPEDLDWRAITDPSTTTVFYMGRNTASEISARLMELGMPADTSVGVGAAIARPEQLLAFCTLESLPDAARQLVPSAPVLIGVGAVFSPVNACGNEQPHRSAIRADLSN